MNSAVHRRMNVLLLLDDGLNIEQIARVLYLDESTDYGAVRFRIQAQPATAAASSI